MFNDLAAFNALAGGREKVRVGFGLRIKAEATHDSRSVAANFEVGRRRGFRQKPNYETDDYEKKAILSFLISSTELPPGNV